MRKHSTQKMKTKPKLTTDFIVKILNAIGQGKLKLKFNVEILKCNFDFRRYSVQFGDYRLQFDVRLGKLYQVLSCRRMSGSTNDDFWEFKHPYVKSTEKNPLKLCSERAIDEINKLFKTENGYTIEVKKKFIVYVNGIPAGRRLQRGENGVVTIGKNRQLSFPDRSCIQHDSEESANKAAEHLREYLNEYEKKKRYRKK